MLFLVAGSAGLIFGFDNGITGGVIAHPGFERKFLAKECRDCGTTDLYCKFANHVVQLFTSSLFLSGGAAAFIGSYTVNIWGRKATMMAGGAAFVAGSVLLANATHWAMLVVGRLVLGVGVGAASMSTPLYLAEMAPAQWRGAVNILFQLSITLGIFIAQLISYALATHPMGWRIALALGAAPGAVLLVGSIFLPETPDFLLTQGKKKRAGEVVMLTHGIDDALVVEQVLADKAAAQCGTLTATGKLRTSWGAIFERRYLFQLLLCTVMPAFQQLTGINAIMFYAPQLFLATGQSTNTALLSTVVIGLVNLVATGVAIFAVDRFGRRFLLLQGGAQMVLTQAAVAWLLKASTGGAGSPAMANALITMVCLYVAAFAWSWGPLGWLVPTEVQPLETRAVGTSLNTVINYLFTFLIGQVFLTMLCTMKWGVFVFFGGCVAVASLLILVGLPETKGLSPERLQEQLAQHPLWSRVLPAPGNSDSSMPSQGKGAEV